MTDDNTQNGGEKMTFAKGAMIFFGTMAVGFLVIGGAGAVGWWLGTN